MEISVHNFTQHYCCVFVSVSCVSCHIFLTRDSPHGVGKGKDPRYDRSFIPQHHVRPRPGSRWPRGVGFGLRPCRAPHPRSPYVPRPAHRCTTHTGLARSSSTPWGITCKKCWSTSQLSQRVQRGPARQRTAAVRVCGAVNERSLWAPPAPCLCPV